MVGGAGAGGAAQQPAGHGRMEADTWKRPGDAGAYAKSHEAGCVVPAGLSGHLPVFHPAQRSSSGTPCRAAVMCCPHPAHVGFPQLEHVVLRHMGWNRPTHCGVLLPRVRVMTAEL